jgi:two-component system chemotaxis family response regulator WspR
VANRRSFDDMLNMEWRRASRESRALSLLMVDVDFLANCILRLETRF